MRVRPSPKTFLILFIFIYVYSGFLYGGRKDIHFQRISDEQGLPNSTVQCFLQCSKGFLWLGTQGGLTRYDGYQFKTYSFNRLESTTLSNDNVKAMVEDRQGMLWISTFTGGINRFDPGQEIFTRFQSDPAVPASLSHNHTPTLYQDVYGTIWVGTFNGLDRLDRENGTFSHYRHDPGNTESLSHNYVTAICEDTDGYLWLGTRQGGINRFHREKETFKRFQTIPGKPDSLSSNEIYTMCSDPEGFIWIGTYGGGLNRLDPKRETFTRFLHDPNDPGSLSENNIVTILKDSAARLWVGTLQEGLNLWDPQKRAFIRFRHDPGNPGSISADHILSVFEDRSGVLWVGTFYGGVNKFDGKPRKFINYNHIYNNPNSLCNNKVFPIYEDQFGEVWLGTFGGGLDRFNPRDETFTHFTCDPASPRSLSGDRVRAIAEDNRGCLWVGTQKWGLNRFNRETNDFTRFMHDPRDPTTIRTDMIQSMYKDQDGVLWIGTNLGLSRLVYKKEPGKIPQQESVTFESLLAGRQLTQSPGENMVKYIIEDHTGMLWLATGGGGLIRFDKKNNTFTHFLPDPNNPHSISDLKTLMVYEDSKKRLWIGTNGAGLDLFHRENERFSHYTTTGGLPDNTICGILEDDKGNLWISTLKGLCRFNPETGAVRNYESGDGLPSSEFSDRSFLKSRDGLMYFGGINGFSVFKPGWVKDNPYPPPVVLTSFKIFEKEAVLSPVIGYRREIPLNYKRNFFSFQFAALDFTEPRKNRYAYKMEGLNDDWIETGNRRYVNFTKLDPGKYTFKVRGSNNDNRWNQQGTSIDIEIIPAFWMTGWFKILLAFIFAVISYLVIGLVRKYTIMFAFWKKKNFIGHYRLVDKIASGGMGIIYKAEDVLDKSRTLALKLMREEYFEDKDQVKRFKNEAAIIDQLNHPNIIKIVERGEHHGQLYMAMELVQGQNLADFLETEKKIDVSTAAGIIAQVADALAFIHQKNIIHRDLKPENIMITRKRENPYFVTLLDFGLARAKNLSRLTQTGMVMGTVYYLAPEQVTAGEISFASDVYALGVICFEMLTGKKPCDGPSNEVVVNNILEKEPEDIIKVRSDIPRGYSRTIMAMLSKEPGERPTMAEVSEVFRFPGD